MVFSNYKRNYGMVSDRVPGSQGPQQAKSNRYELNGDMSNCGTTFSSIRIPNLFDSENEITSGKLFYGKDSEFWSDIYWRSCADIDGNFLRVVFTEIQHKTLVFRLHDLHSFLNSPDGTVNFFKGRIFTINPPTVPHAQLAQSFLKSYRRQFTLENIGTYEFRGCLERQVQ